MSTQSASQRAVGRTMFSISLYRQAQKGIWSSELCQRTKIRGTVEYAKISKIRWHVMRYSDDRWARRLRTGSLGTSNEHQDDRRPDGQTPSRKL
ncbi:hypothetical protein V3C99_008395 [Haemonchus contortus]